MLSKPKPFMTRVGVNQQAGCQGRYSPPRLIRSTDNSWARAEAVRDGLYDAFEDVCKRHSISALILKSPPYVYPLWVRFECWFPQNEQPTVAERIAIKITIQPKQYHRFPFEFEIDWKYGETSVSLKNLIGIDSALIEEVVQFVVGEGPKPKFRRTRLHTWQLWRPRNKVIASYPDILGRVGTLLYLSAIGVFYLGLVSLIDEQTRTVPALMLLILGIVLGIAGYAIANRHYLIRTEGKPLAEPRYLSRVDSWQTVIFGMAKECQIIRTQFMEKLKEPPTINFRLSQERVWYWGIDGPEEREQIVLSSGRGVVFCQIYSYGNDLYVGWDGHLNTGHWLEEPVYKGRDRISGMLTSFNVVKPATQQLTEYDVIDISCLMEWTHAQLVKLIKRLIDENRIDQEVDFKIIRGERNKLTEKEKDTKGKRFSTLFKRTA